jgi:hypothetical protein
MSNGRPIVLEIRKRLMTLCNQRERAYREAQKQYLPVPRLKEKFMAIESLRIQLQASVNWDLHAHINIVNGFADRIELLMPDIDSRYVGMRKSIAGMVHWCYTQAYSQTLNKAA